jgi:hypothetical protein
VVGHAVLLLIDDVLIGGLELHLQLRRQIDQLLEPERVAQPGPRRAYAQVGAVPVQLDIPGPPTWMAGQRKAPWIPASLV